VLAADQHGDDRGAEHAGGRLLPHAAAVSGPLHAAPPFGRTPSRVSAAQSGCFGGWVEIKMCAADGSNCSSIAPNSLTTVVANETAIEVFPQYLASRGTPRCAQLC
jgi:hypothetical protein